MIFFFMGCRLHATGLLHAAGSGRSRPGGCAHGRGRRVARDGLLRGVAGERDALAGHAGAVRRCTTAAARAPESCQLDGYCEVAIGRSSVWPSTSTGCLASSAMIAADPVEGRERAAR